MTHDQSAQHCRSGHTPCTGLFLSPVHHARHKVCRLLLFTSTHTDVKSAFLTLCDLDEKMNHDKEGVPLPPEKQGWKIEIRQG